MSSGWGDAERTVPILLAVMAVVVVAGTVVPFAAATTTTNEDRVTVDVPSSVTVGSETTIQGTVETKERRPGYEATFVVRLYIDGEQQAEKEVTISDGDRETVTFSHTFDSSGEHAVTVEAEAKGANPYRDSRTVSITVEKPDTPSATPDMSTPEPRTPSTPTTPTRPTVTASGPESVSASGAAFAVPESLQDEVDAYRDSLPSSSLAPHAFVLAAESELYLVFTDEEPQKGAATVEGLTTAQSLDAANQSFTGVAASSVEFDTTGTERDLTTVAENPDQYQLELVRVTGDYRRSAILTDPDQGNDVNVSETAGVIAADPPTATEFARDLGTAAGTLVDEPSGETVRGLVGGSDVPHLWTASLETKYWSANEATVDGIVIPPSSPGRAFLEEFGTADTLPASSQEPVLYLVDEQYDATTVDSVTELNQRASQLDGDIVTVTARTYEQRVSVQETLEHGTPCGEDLVPVKEACVNVPQDVTLHGGVAWNDLPQSREGILPIVAASNVEVDQPSETGMGRYRLTGEVVASSRINESLPEGAVLFVYEAERTDDINYDLVARESKELIEERAQQAADRLRSQAADVGFDEQDGGQNDRSERTVRDVTADRPTRIEFPSGERAGGVEAVELRTSRAVEAATVTVQNVSRPPSDIGTPPGTALQYVNITAANLPEDAIQSASIRIRVSVSASASTNVTVYRYHDGQWQPLETEVVSRAEGSIVVEAQTDGFSYFAVTSPSGTQQGADSGESASTEEPTSGSGPGFSIPLSLLGMLLALLAVRVVRN